MYAQKYVCHITGGGAVAALVILGILRLLLRDKPDITVWSDRIILFPAAYIAAHLCTKGIRFTSYSSQRDFCIIILTAMLFYFAMLTGRALYKARASRKKDECRR